MTSSLPQPTQGQSSDGPAVGVLVSRATALIRQAEALSGKTMPPEFWLVCGVEPRLLDVLAGIVGEYNNTDEEYDGNAVFFGYWGRWGYKDWIVRLVGHDADNPMLRTCEAYDAAYLPLYRCMPPDRPGYQG